MTDESSAGGKPARHASSQARLRRAGVPWRMRRGCVRPGAAGLVAGLAIVALWLAALTFDARVLVAAAIAWTAVWLMSGCWGCCAIGCGTANSAWTAGRAGYSRGHGRGNGTDSPLASALPCGDAAA